jgi:predicted phage terminase large subunit-like protein
MSRAKQLVLLQEALRRKARNSFSTFYRWMNPQFDLPWHAKLVCEEYESCFQGTHKKLCVSMPPGHAKSFITNHFIAWVLGHDPDCRVITTSYSDRLVRRNCQAVQDIMTSDLYRRVFPEISIDSSKPMTTKEFHIRGRAGYLLAEAAGGQITGFRADLLVVDDPYKGMSSAKSEVGNENVQEWYDATFRSRGHDLTREIVIHTRWTPDDLIGWLMAREPGQWNSVVLPAMKEGTAWEHPKDPRKTGEALWPNMISQDGLEERREQNPYIFSALYQQRPTLAEGELLKVEWTTNRWTELPTDCRFIQSWDLRNGGKGSNSSYAVGQLWAQKGTQSYLVEQVRGRWDFPDTLKVMEEQQSKPLWCNTSTILIEDKADGRAAIPVLKQKFPGILPVNPKGSKEERLSTVTTYWQCGNVLLPKGAPWLSLYIDEITRFPSTTNDDQVDATTQALEWIYNVPKFAFVI